MSMFAFLFDAYYVQLLIAVTAQAARGLSAIAAVLQAIIVIYVGLVGLAVLWGKTDAGEMQERVLRVLLVAALLTPAHFNAWVLDVFLTQAPAFSTQVASGDVAPAGLPAQFDQISQAVDNMRGQAMAQASGFANIGARLEIGMVSGAITLVLVACFAVMIAAYAMVGLVVDLATVTLVAYLFKATRGIADRTIGKLIGLSLLGMLVKILLQIIITQNENFLRTLAATGGSLEIMTTTLWHIAAVFTVGLFLLIMLPGIAAYIGGGVSFSPAPMMAFAASKLKGR